MESKEITLELDKGMKLTFRGSASVIEEVMDKLFEEAKVSDLEAARDVALNSSDIDAVINVLTFCNDALTTDDIETIYKKHKGTVEIVGEIASNSKTPSYIIKELMEYHEETISELAKLEWEQRKPCPQCKGSGRKSPCMGMICEHCKGTGKI